MAKAPHAVVVETGDGRWHALATTADFDEGRVTNAASISGIREVHGITALSLVDFMADAGGDFLKGDVGDLADIEAIVASVVERHGRVDVLVNNAGVTKSLGFFDVTEADWDRIHRVNAKGLFFCMVRAKGRIRMPAASAE